MDRTVRRRVVVQSTDGPAGVAMTDAKRDGTWSTGTYASASRESVADWRTSRTTPTTVRTTRMESRPLPCSYMRRRCPTARDRGHRERASDSLIIATGSASTRSKEVNARPSVSGTSRSLNQFALTERTDARADVGFAPSVAIRFGWYDASGDRLLNATMPTPGARESSASTRS
jgi:hypothetical protein